jgi:hypothetical protein
MGSKRDIPARGKRFFLGNGSGGQFFLGRFKVAPSPESFLFILYLSPSPCPFLTKEKEKEKEKE